MANYSHYYINVAKDKIEAISNQLTNKPHSVFENINGKSRIILECLE